MILKVFNVHSQRYWLYALAAIVLLLQSFAVWHDVEHPFHHAEVQCERLNAITHLPVADIIPELAITLHSEIAVSNTLYNVYRLTVSPRQQHAIRAPPVLS